MDRDTYTNTWRRGERVKGASSPHRVVIKEDFLLPPPLIWTSHLTLWLNTQRSAFLASSVYYSVMNTVFVKDPEIETLSTIRTLSRNFKQWPYLGPVRCSSSKIAGHRDWRPEFDLQNPCGGKKELISTTFPLISTRMLRHTCMFICTHAHK